MSYLLLLLLLIPSLLSLFSKQTAIASEPAENRPPRSTTTQIDAMHTQLIASPTSASISLSQEASNYTQFLAQPNTGLAQVLPSVGLSSSGQLTSKQPSFTNSRSSKPFLQAGNQLSPDFTVQVTQGYFQIVLTDLDYGFMVNLGDVPLDDLTNLAGQPVPVPAHTCQFFYSYRPPKDLAALQVDRHRFITGKVGRMTLTEPLLSQAPARLHQTYLMRSLQFKLPEFVSSPPDPTSSPSNSAAEPPSSDLLIAFRPVSQRIDGSFTVLWRILAKFPDPQLEDLNRASKDSFL